MATLVEFAVGQLTFPVHVQRKEQHAALYAELLLLLRGMPPVAETIWRQHDHPTARLRDGVAAVLFKRAHEGGDADAARADA